MDVNKSIICLGCIILCLGGALLGLRGLCSLCHDKAAAECDAATASNSAQLAEKRQAISIQLKKASASERRKQLHKWVVE